MRSGFGGNFGRKLGVRLRFCIAAVIVVVGDCILWLWRFGVMGGIEKGTSSELIYFDDIQVGKLVYFRGF